MKKLIFITVIACGILACGNNSESSSTELGKSVFQTNCVACHLANGQGGVNGAKNLRESALTVKQRVNIITNGSEVNRTMVAYKTILSPKEIQAVAEYTTTFKK
ncbi:MAG: c-type cytochrome [Saprospiraceae bacterium]